jgi:hypothetical protein
MAGVPPRHHASVDNSGVGVAEEDDDLLIANETYNIHGAPEDIDVFDLTGEAEELQHESQPFSRTVSSPPKPAPHTDVRAMFLEKPTFITRTRNQREGYEYGPAAPINMANFTKLKGQAASIQSYRAPQPPKQLEQGPSGQPDDTSKPPPKNLPRSNLARQVGFGAAQDPVNHINPARPHAPPSVRRPLPPDLVKTADISQSFELQENVLTAMRDLPFPETPPHHAAEPTVAQKPSEGPPKLTVAIPRDGDDSNFSHEQSRGLPTLPDAGFEPKGSTHNGNIPPEVAGAGVDFEDEDLRHSMQTNQMDIMDEDHTLAPNNPHNPCETEPGEHSEMAHEPHAVYVNQREPADEVQYPQAFPPKPNCPPPQLHPRDPPFPHHFRFNEIHIGTEGRAAEVLGATARKPTNHQRRQHQLSGSSRTSNPRRALARKRHASSFSNPSFEPHSRSLDTTHPQKRARTQELTLEIASVLNNFTQAHKYEREAQACEYEKQITKLMEDRDVALEALDKYGDLYSRQSDEIKRAQASAVQMDAHIKTLEANLSASTDRARTIEAKYQTCKEHLNAAIVEQQNLYRQTKIECKDAIQKIQDMKEEQKAAMDHLTSTADVEREKLLQRVREVVAQTTAEVEECRCTLVLLSDTKQTDCTQ